MNIKATMQKRGFTLIELLVVISISGLLSSVVLASFGGSREKARIAAAQQASGSLYRTYGVDTVAYFDFENDTTSITDSIGNGYTAVLPAACSIVSDSPNTGGKGLECNGTGGILITPTNDSDKQATYAAGASFTYALWFKPTANQTDLNRMILGRNGYHSGINPRNNNSLVAFSYFGSAPSTQTASVSYTRSLEIGKWYFIAYSVDSIGRTMRLYVDGAEVSKANFPVGLNLFNAGSNAYFIGAAAGSSAYAAIGRMDKVAIYKRGLGIAEIQSMYLADAEKYNKPLAIINNID